MINLCLATNNFNNEDDVLVIFKATEICLTLHHL